MGSRIGIMRDGEMTRIGTPGEIMIHPKDSYVADFVQGLSHLKPATVAVAVLVTSPAATDWTLVPHYLNPSPG